MKYLKNAWYAAAYCDEVTDAPFARQILDRDMVIFRTESGVLAMLEDRCPHRFAPLSAGKIIGETLQCPYHGLQFDGSGACVHNPHVKGGAPLKAAKVAAWPLLEKYGILWCWPGDPDRADEAALPEIEFLEQADDYSIVKGLLHVRGHYELVVDNLLDLSHAAYIHPQFSGDRYTTEELLAAATQKLERRERSIVNHRMRSGLVAPSASQALFDFDDQTPVHTDSTMIWHPPAMLDFKAGSWEMDKPRESGAHIPQLHFITPETEFTSHYFFVNGRNRRKGEPEVDKALLDFFNLAFGQQDEPMIEMVQRRMGTETDVMALDPILLKTDAAPISARRMLASLIDDEESENQAQE